MGQSSACRSCSLNIFFLISSFIRSLLSLRLCGVLDLRQLAFSFESQLTTGRIDVVAFFAAQGGGDLLSFERLKKSFLNVFRWAFPGKVFDFVVRNEIHFGV